MYIGGKSIVGVDIGHDSIKVAAIRRGNKPAFVGCCKVPIDSQYVRKDGFADPALVAAKLKEALRTAQPKALHPTAAVAVLPESIIFRKTVDLPMTVLPDEVAGAVRLQVAEYLPLPAENMQIDYRPVGVSADGQTQQIMVVAADYKIVNDYCAVFDKAGLELVAIDTKPASLGRAIVAAGEKDVVIIVDIGSEVTTVSVYHDGAIQVTSTLNQAANSLKDQATGTIDAEKSAVLAKRLCQGISDEIEHVIKFYSNRSIATVSGHVSVRVAGGGSMVEGLDTMIGEQLALSVVSAKPLLAVPDYCDRRYLGAIGAALYPGV